MAEHDWPAWRIGPADEPLQPLAGYLLTPEQEIRARALDSTATALGPLLATLAVLVDAARTAGVGPVLDDAEEFWRQAARRAASWVEHGDGAPE
jgi:hypothetical protein